MKSKKEAIILAGGKGTRLLPYTIHTPKPMVPVGNLPILEIVIKQLKKNNFNKITIAVNYQANLIMDYFLDGSKWGVKIKYSLEKNPLGTMGPLKIIENLPDNFLVMNGDILTNLDFVKFYEFHVKNNNNFTIAAYTRKEKIDYGVLDINKDKLINFSEKPDKVFNVSMGVYMINKSIIKYIAKDKLFGFDDLMIKLLNKKIKINTILHKGYWLDIGRNSDYEKAIKDFEKKTIKKEFL